MLQPKKIMVPKSEKTLREQRINERKQSVKANLTVKDVIEYLNDTNDRLSDIYDMLKKLTS
ncbi:hypothetical protein A7D23_05925 [Dehalobacter sp. TeCB1]|nr:hypothetical protein A7D23_05925 [Dehalobacter sp. TeCB1]